MHDAGKVVLCKPWPIRNGDLYPKNAFNIDLAEGFVTCPAKKRAAIEAGKAQFAAKHCDTCPLREQCTRAALGRGRSIAIHEQEALLIKLRTLKSSSVGRQQLRARVEVEHALAHLSRRQGPRARYIGERMNTFDVRRCAAVENLHAIDHFQRAA